MKILIICSKNFYGKIEKLKMQIESMGHEIYLSNCYDDPSTEEKYRAMGEREHQKFKARMYKQSEDIIKKMDAVLVLNYDKEKNGVVYKNYIGGATFLEMYDAFRLDKKIYMMNPIPDNILYDEIAGFGPVILNGNLSMISNQHNEEEISFNPEFYINWIEYIMNGYRNYIEDTFIASNIFDDNDKKNLKLLSKFYNFLSVNIPPEFSVSIPDVMGKAIRIQYNFVGYEIGYLSDIKHGYKYYIKKVSLTNNSSQYYSFEALLHNNIEKRYTIKHIEK